MLLVGFAERWAFGGCLEFDGDDGVIEEMQSAEFKAAAAGMVMVLRERERERDKCFLFYYPVDFINDDTVAYCVNWIG